MIGVGWAGLIERLSAASRPRARWLTSAALCLGAFGAGQVMYDLYRPHHGPGAAQAQQVGRELRDRVRPQDVVVVSGDRGLSDASLDWYTSGLAAPRVTDLLRAPDSSADRVWLVVMGSNCVPATEEARLLAALGPGWVTARRTEYFYPADEQEVQLHYVVHCLVGHSSPPLP